MAASLQTYKDVIPRTSYNVLNIIFMRTNLARGDPGDGKQVFEITGGDWSALLEQYDYVVRQLRMALQNEKDFDDPFLQFEQTIRALSASKELQPLRDASPELDRQLREHVMLHSEIGREQLLARAREATRGHLPPAGSVWVLSGDWTSIKSSIGGFWKAYKNDDYRTQTFSELLRALGVLGEVDVEQGLKNYLNAFAVCALVEPWDGQPTDVIVNTLSQKVTVDSTTIRFKEIGEDPYTQGVHDFYL